VNTESREALSCWEFTRLFKQKNRIAAMNRALAGCRLVIVALRKVRLLVRVVYEVQKNTKRPFCVRDEHIKPAL